IRVVYVGGDPRLCSVLGEATPHGRWGADVASGQVARRAHVALVVQAVQGGRVEGTFAATRCGEHRGTVVAGTYGAQQVARVLDPALHDGAVGCAVEGVDRVVSGFLAVTRLQGQLHTFVDLLGPGDQRPGRGPT